MASLTKFIKKGFTIESKFVNIDDDRMDWYKGVVTKVNKYGEDRFGCYVECNIQYDDGELVKNHRLYDTDYGDEVWRFDTKYRELIEHLFDTVNLFEETFDEDDIDYDGDEETESDDETESDNDENKKESDDETESESELAYDSDAPTQNVEVQCYFMQKKPSYTTVFIRTLFNVYVAFLVAVFTSKMITNTYQPMLKLTPQNTTMHS